MSDERAREIQRLLSESMMAWHDQGDGHDTRIFERPRYISRNELRRELARLIYDVERNRNRPEEFPK